jgi:hypothetical protein
MDMKKIPNPIQGAKDKAQEATAKLQEQGLELAAAAQEKIEDVLDEYQKIIPVAESLGLTVDSFDVEMGLIPEISTALVGSMEQINKEAVQKMITENQNNKLLATMLNALLIAKDLQKRLNIKNLKGIRVDIKLGISPKVSVRLAP